MYICFKNRYMGKKNKIVFVLEGEELKSSNKWIKKQLKKNPSVGTIGDRFEYRFVPTSIGTGVTVYDSLTKKSKNVTNYDRW